MQKNLNGFTDIILKQDGKMHLKDHNTSFCSKNLEI